MVYYGLWGVLRSGFDTNGDGEVFGSSAAEGLCNLVYAHINGIIVVHNGAILALLLL